MKLRNIIFENSGVGVFWDEYVRKAVFILPMYAEKWALIKKEEKSWANILSEVDIFLADGVGLSWGYKFLTGKKISKISGIDLIDSLIEKYPKTPTYIWGTSEENIKKAAEVYKKRGLNVVGYHDGFGGKATDVIADIKKSGATVCFVGNQAKKAAELALRAHEDLGITTMTAGGSFDVASGKRKRAPKIFQKIGLEWLWRMIIEPRRFKRVPALFSFVWYVLKEKVE